MGKEHRLVGLFAQDRAKLTLPSGRSILSWLRVM